MRTVLYLHGFLSGPGSKKACVLRDLCEAEGANYVAPDLNMSPEEAAALIWSEYEKAPPSERWPWPVPVSVAFMPHGLPDELASVPRS